MPENGHFARFNALIDSGLVGKLPAMQLRVVLVFLRHANQTGAAWPSPQRVGELLDMNVRNVRRAIAGLVRRGVLTGGDAGAGRGLICKRIININAAENRAQCAPISPEENRAQDGKKTGRKSTIKPGANRPKNRAHCARRTTNEQLREQHNNNTGAADAAESGGGCEFLFRWMNKDDARDAVRRHGPEHCQRCVRLTELLQESVRCRSPKRFLRGLLAKEAVDVDFTQLDAAEEAARFDEEESGWRKQVDDAKVAIATLPKDQVKRLKEEVKVRYPDWEQDGRDVNVVRAVQLIREVA